MRITEVNIPADEARGLKEIKMKKLGQIVILAGKNGSGKSRILNKISETIRVKPQDDQIARGPNAIESAKRQIETHNKYIKDLETRLAVNENPSLRNDIKKNQSYIKDLEHEIEKIEKIVSWNEITTDCSKDGYGTVTFVPKSLDLKDSGALSKEALGGTHQQSFKIGLHSIHNSAFATIQFIQEKWFNTSHPSSLASTSEKIEAEADYFKLKDIIAMFLDTEIKRDSEGYATLFDKRFNQLNLSDGQKIILQLCIAIYIQEINLKDLILILDEPENHLHPKALKETIDWIIECVPDGQIWIATHSITLLSQFDPNVIWYVDDGGISHGGKKPEKVLNSLLGDADDVSKLQDFLDLPAQFATSKYTLECLFPPEVLLTDANDPQINQIYKTISTIKDGKEKLKILDFGAGKGRLVANLSELSKNHDVDFSSSVDYVAFDLPSLDKEICIQNISNVYGDSNKRYFDSESEIFASHDRKSFDVVVMTNVLHEIPPADWLRLFKGGGFIDRILKDDGYLLIVEDNQIPKGEKAYTKGFLVLNTEHLKDVFNIPANEKMFIVDSERNGRLKAHLVPKSYLKNICSESIKTALLAIKDTSIEKINALRTSGSTSYSDGRLHGYYSQQLTNAILNLETI